MAIYNILIVTCTFIMHDSEHEIHSHVHACACKRVRGVRTCARCAYMREACVRARGVRTCARRAYVREACVRARGVRTCARRAYMREACVRARGMRTCVSE